MVKQLALSTLIFLAVLCMVSSLLASEARTFDRIRVKLTDGRRISGRHARLTSDSLTFQYLGEEVNFTRNQIDRLDRCIGTRAKTGLFLGAVVGGGLVLSSHMFGDSSPVPDNSGETSAVRVVLGSAVGGLIGLAVGSFLPKWKRVPLQPGVGFVPNGRAGLQLTLHF